MDCGVWCGVWGVGRCAGPRDPGREAEALGSSTVHCPELNRLPRKEVLCVVCCVLCRLWDGEQVRVIQDEKLKQPISLAGSTMRGRARVPQEVHGEHGVHRVAGHGRV